MSIDWSDPTLQDEPLVDDGTAAAPTAEPETDQGVTLVRGERRPRVRTGRAIPWNILQFVREASRRHGVPEWALIAVLQQENGSFNPKAVNLNADGTRDRGIAQINDKARLADFGGDKQELIDCANEPSCAIDYLAQSTRGVFENERRQTAEGAPESDEVLWLNAAANWHRSVRDSEWSDYRQRLTDLSERGYVPSGKKAIVPTTPRAPTAAEKRSRAPVSVQDVYDLYDELLGRAPDDLREAQGNRFDASGVGRPYGSVRAEITASPEAQLWRDYGPRIKNVRSWVNTLYQQYLGQSPTNVEMRAVIDNRWTPDSLETWLRDRPYGGSTLGAASDLRTLARSEAKKWLGREADEAEVNWLLSSGKTSPDDISAFYEQAKQRHDSGDPTFAWAADPASWRDTRKRLQQQWSSLGLRGDVDPRTVNQALTEKWSDEDATAAFNALPAPGYPQEMNVGEVNRVRSIAKRWRDFFFPGGDVTREEVVQFRGQAGVAGNEAIRHYYASLPADWSGETKVKDAAAQPTAQAPAR